MVLNKFMHPPTLPANMDSYFPDIYQSNLKKKILRKSCCLYLNRAYYEFNLKNLIEPISANPSGTYEFLRKYGFHTSETMDLILNR